MNAPRATLTKDVSAAHLNSDGRARIIVRTYYSGLQLVGEMLELFTTQFTLSMSAIF